MSELVSRRKLRPIITVIAAVMLALNIRMFVKVGGLYTGGATECNSGIHRFPLYRKEIHDVFPDSASAQWFSC